MKSSKLKAQSSREAASAQVPERSHLRATGMRCLRRRNVRLLTMRVEKSDFESQRDSGLQPRVARNELPRESARKTPNFNGVAARRGQSAVRPFGLRSLAQPAGQKIIAQRFSAGTARTRNQVPSGAKEIMRHPASVVPDGTFWFTGPQPSTEVLGHFRLSLRDCTNAFRSLQKAARPPIAAPLVPEFSPLTVAL